MKASAAFFRQRFAGRWRFLNRFPGTRSAFDQPHVQQRCNWMGAAVVGLAFLLASSARAQTPLTNGANHIAVLVANTTNTYTLNASAGDSLVLRIGATNFNPRIELYGPAGALVASAGVANLGVRDAVLTVTATNGGTYTVGISSFNAGGGYGLTLAKIPGVFSISPGDEGGALINGAATRGTNTLGDLDMWTFSATNGDNIVLRMGTVGFNPRIDLYGPDGRLAGTAGAGSLGLVDAVLSATATNTGTFTVVASAFVINQTGPYTLSLARVPGAFVVSPGDQGGTLTNGAANPGVIAIGDLDVWSFTASANDSLVLRMGGSNFNPRINLYDPAGRLIATAGLPNLGVYDATLSATATNAGTYTVVVSSFNLNDGGNYTLHLAQIPGAFVVSPGDQGGTLTNGAANPGVIAIGDLDVWSFTASANDSLVLRMGGSNFNPRINLYDPAGRLVATAGAGNLGVYDATLSATATNAGTYTVVVSSFNLNDGGNYTLHLAQIPGGFVVSAGDQGGELLNGAANPGVIAIGDLDVWSFTASANDSLVLRMGGSNFNPRINLYDPAGKLVATAGAGNLGVYDATLSATATNAGTYTVVVSSFNLNDGGNYTLHLAQIPGGFVVSAGDQGGELLNGAANPGVITLGDLDMWRFSANAGDSLLVRMGGSNFNPRVNLYDPSGTLIASGGAPNLGVFDAALSATATNAGTYTVVASAFNLTQIGNYILSLARVPDGFVVSPGDQGGVLTNGTANPGTIPVGDLDMWSFTATHGDNIVLRAGGVGFNPRLDLFGPDGKLLGTGGAGNLGFADATIAITATNSGTFVVVVSAFVPVQSGTYTLHLAQIPGAFVVSPGDQGGALINGFRHLATNTLGDLDMWSFYGTGGDSNFVWLVASNFNADVRLYSPTGGVLRSFTTTTSNSFAYVVTNEGLYTILVQSTVVNGNGFYTLRQSRVPPDLIVPGTTSIDESNTLNVTISAQDPDVPDKPLTFTLISGPPGLTLTPAGNTNANISWPTVEATGPSTNTVVVSVTDVVNGNVFIRTNRFTVIVNEVNLTPILTVPANQTINELTPLNVSASAIDADIPTNPLTFSLIAPPEGMTINPTTGAISWIPSEAQGPSTNVITVVVTDSSPAAVNATQLSATNSFIVIVREVNVAPQLAVPANQTVDELTALNVSAAATDSDAPANSLTFALISPPAGMTINPNSGAIAWTPTEGQGPSVNPITVVVTDNSPLAINATQLSTTNTFTVTVREVNTAPQLTVPGNQTIDELTPLNVSASATDSDSPANPLTFSLVSPPEGMTVNATSGAISWTPSEAQGPSTNTIRVVVTDNSSGAAANQQLSATNTFTVIVRELNVAPQLTVPATQTIDELTPLNVSVTATDSDVPANPLTFSLLSAPTGMTINAASGAISWTPSEAQGPSSNFVTVVVRDTNSAAAANQQFSITNSFSVIVRDVNSPPVFQAITNPSIHFGAALSVQVFATDSDVPTNSVTFSLMQSPSNLTFNATSGLITWTPAQSQVGTHSMSVRATDNGTPSLSATQTFQVNVTGEGSRLAIQQLPGGLMQISITGDIGLNYELQISTNLESWARLLQFRLDTSPHLYIDPASAAVPVRFYKLQLIQP